MKKINVNLKFMFALIASFSFVLLSSANDNAERQIPSDGKCKVEFNLNYPEGTDTPSALVIKENGVIGLESKPMPTREGYRFAGWYTNEACKPEQEWLFGVKSGGVFSTITSAAVKDSMAVKNSMTLYARWVSPTHIKTADEFDAIRKDFYGWYVLDNDIDLSGYADWDPIGEYNTSYEFADGEWWDNAFKGKLDGQGYKISNLNLMSPNKDIKALFSAAANAEIVNVIIDNCKISLTTETIYIAPLVGILKEDETAKALVKNCKVTNLDIDVKLDNNASIFSSVTGLIAGVWNGTIEDCHVDGNMLVSVEGSGKGELYVGGLIGESYCNTIKCSSALNINTSIKGCDEIKIHIGGLQSSATNVQNCLATGNINVEGCEGIKELYIGGLIGSERYGVVENCASQGHILVRNTPIAQVGGVIGEFNKTFGGLGPVFGVVLTEIRNCYSSRTVSTELVECFVLGGISGSGKPDPLTGWVGTMNYILEDCAFVATEGVTTVDENISSFHRHSTESEMEGFKMQTILEKKSGAGNWIYNTSLPLPNMGMIE